MSGYQRTRNLPVRLPGLSGWIFSVFLICFAIILFTPIVYAQNPELTREVETGDLHERETEDLRSKEADDFRKRAVDGEDFSRQSVLRDRYVTDELQATVPPASHPGTVQVPDVVGKSLAQAHEILKESRLRVEEVEPTEPGYFDGPVVRQSPRAGTKAVIDSGLRLVVGGRGRADVPARSSGRPESDTGNLSRVRIPPGENPGQETADKNPDSVIERDPQPDTETILVRPRNPTLEVEPGPGLVSVPDLTGLTGDQASLRLRRSSLILGEITTMASDYGENMIFRQSPAAGEIVKPGTVVNVLVSAPIRVEVPHLIDRPFLLAEPILIESQLQLGRVRERDSIKEDGIVLDQRPVPGARVQAGSRVDIIVARHIIPPPSPPDEDGPIDIPGESRPDTAIEREEVPESPQAIVPPPSHEDERSPSPEENEVSAEEVGVPDLIGLDLSQARNRISTARLTTGNLKEASSGLETGTVLQQQPVAGKMVEPGTSVSLVLAVAKPVDYSWWGISLVVLVVGASGALLILKRPGTEARSEKGSNRVELEITPNLDRGTTRVESDQLIDGGFELRLRVIGDPGVQGLEPGDGLIQKESKRHD